jgi:hypothetical protein
VDQVLAERIYNSAFKEGADLIQGKVPIDEIKNGDTDTFYSDIFEFADIDSQRFHKMDPKTRFDKKHEAAERLERGFNRYWPREDDVEFELSFGGDTVSLHISDSSGSTDLATHRSTGFRHFLSFYIRLIAASGEEFEDSILLLDGPGIHLHPEAQKKLKEALENLAEDNQVVLSTHSPFMIDSNHIERIRIIQQDTDSGTQITSDLDKASDSNSQVGVLAPVRTSIGANFADSLFASSANILVEGYTDKRYLEAFSHMFRREKSGPTINYETNVIDVDGSKADYLAKILDAEGYDYVILLDSDHGGKTRKASLMEKGIDEERIRLLTDLIPEYDKENEITIEDCFSPDLFGEYMTEVNDEVQITDIDEVLEGQSVGIINNIESRLSELEGRDEIDDGSFSKGEIADLICDHIIEEELTSEVLKNDTVERFKQLIEDLNKSL